MPTPYQFTPQIPSAPHPTPGSDYKLPPVKSTRRPVQNPYDKFTQPEFDAWIGGITNALKRALGQEEDEEHARPDKRDPTKFLHTQPNAFDDANELSDDHIDDSFAEVKARRTVSKGKARDPREGPGFGKGDSANPIDLVSSDEEEAEEVELSIAVGKNFESDEEGSLSGEEYSWERGQESSPLAPSPSPKISEHERDEREEEAYGSEEYEDEERPGERGERYDEYDDDEYYDDDDEADEHRPQVPHSEVIDLSSDDDEIEEDISESEQPARKIRKVSPERRVEEEGEPSWSDGEGETDEGSEVEELRRENPWANSARRVQGEPEQRKSPEVINLDSDEEGQPDEGEGEASGLQDKNSNQEITRINSKRHDAQQGDYEDFSDGHDDFEKDDGEDGIEEEGEGDEDDAAASQVPLSHDRTSAVRSQHDRHELSEVFDVDDEIQEVQPMENDTSFPPKQSVSPPFESSLPEIPDPWSGPRTYTEDFYSGGDVQIPVGETVNPHHLGPNDNDPTPNLIIDGNLGDAVVQPVADNTAFPPSEDQQTSVDISDPWKGPQLYAEDFYTGGPVQQHGSLATAHYLGPMDVDNLSDLIHDAVTREPHLNEEEMQPQGTDTSFPQGVEESENLVDIADPWFGPQTYAEDFYSGGDVRTLPGVPIDPALLSGTGDIEDDIDNFLTPGALTPSQTNTPNDIEGEEEHEIIQPPGPQRRIHSPRTRRSMSIPEDADIIAIEDSDEEQDLPAMPDELDELDELDEDDNLSLQYPDFGDNHQPLGIIQEDKLDSNEVIVPPMQLDEGEEPDADVLNRQFQYDSEDRFDLETPLAENISVTIGRIEELAEETELNTTRQSKDQEHVEIRSVDDCQDNLISKDDESEVVLDHSSQTVESDSLALPHAEGQFTTTTVLDLEGDFGMHSALQDNNTAIEDLLAKESNRTNIEVIDENNTVTTTVSTAEQVLGDSANFIDQELDEEGIRSPPAVHDTGSQDLHPTSAGPVVASSLGQTSGQLPTPPSEGERYVSLPPESSDEPSREVAKQVTEAAAVPFAVNELSQLTDYVDPIEHTVFEPPDEDTEAEKGAGEEFDHANDDVEIRTAYTGEDVDHVLFSVEEPTTEGRLTEEPPESQLSPSEETATVGLDKDLEISVSPHNEPLKLEVSLSQSVGTDLMESANNPDVDAPSKVSRDEDATMVAMPDNVLDPFHQPITSNISTATQVIHSASVLNFLDTSATPLAAMGPSAADEGPNSQMLREFAQHPFNALTTSNDLAQTLENDQPTSVANISTPTGDVFGMLPFVSNSESIAGLDGQVHQYLGTTSLPYRAPSTSTRVVLTRKPTDPVLMADPYPYCLSTPDISPYTQQPGELSSGKLDSRTTNSQIDQGMTKNEAGPDAGLLSQKTNSEPRSDIFPATTEEGSSATGGSQPTRKRKRNTASAKSHQGSIVEAGDGTSPSVAETAQEGLAKGTLSNGKRRTKERKSTTLNKSSSRSSKKKVTGNIPETTSHETILVNPRMEVRPVEPATAVAPTQEENPANLSAAPAGKIFPPANNLSVVSPALSHRSFTSQPSPTVSKPNLLLHPNAISESLLHAHGQKRKAMLSQAMQQSISPRPQTKIPQLFRFPSTPMIITGQASSSTSTISPIDTTKLPVIASAAAAASPTDVTSTAVPAKPVTPIQKANSIPARQLNRSTPVTRSHCRYHRISLPKEEGGPRVSFLVPGCSLNDKELMDEEEIVDHGDATVDDSRNMLKDIETLGFSLDLIGVLRQLVGLDILREQEIFYLPQPGEVVTRRNSHQKSASTVRFPGDGSSYAGSPGYSSYLMASPGPSRPPHSASSWSESPSLSSLLRQPAIVAGSDHAGTEKGYASTEGGLDTESEFTDDEDPNGKDVKPSPSDPTTSKSKGKQARKSKGRKGIDLTYEPDENHDDEESDAPTTTTITRKRRKSTRGTKRNRESDAVPIGDDSHERDAKKPKTEMDTPQEPPTPAHPQNTTL